MSQTSTGEREVFRYFVQNEDIVTVFGGEPEYLKPRTKMQHQRRITVLAMRTYTAIGLGGEEADYREDLKRRCALDHLAYDSVQVESALRRARGLRG